MKERKNYGRGVSNAVQQLSLVAVRKNSFIANSDVLKFSAYEVFVQIRCREFSEVVAKQTKPT